MLIIRDKKSKKFLYRSIISFAVGALVLFLKKFVKDPNAADFLVILGSGACILAVWFYYKSLSNSIELIVKPALRKVYERVKKSVKKTISKIKSKLSVPFIRHVFSGIPSFFFILLMVFLTDFLTRS